MEKYTLRDAEIDDKYRNIEIYPKTQVPDEYLIHWDGFQVGTIQKRDDKWFTSAVDLITVVNEIGAFLDGQGVAPE